MLKRLLLFLPLLILFCHTVVSQSISSNSPLCTDNSPTLELKASGGSTYAWSGPNNFTSNLQNPTISKATALNAGTYTCLVDGKTTLTTVVKVGKYPFAWYAYGYVYGSVLNVYTYTDGSYESNLFSFNWTGPNGFTSKNSYNNLTNANKNMQGTYTINVKDEFGCSSAASYNVQFSNPECPYIPYIAAVSNTTTNTWSTTSTGTTMIDVCEGSLMTMKTDTLGWGKVSIQWYKDDKAIANANTLNLNANSEGVYYVNIVKGTCSYNSYKVQIKYTSPSLYISSRSGNASENSICKNDGYTNLYASLNRSFHADSQTYQWYKDGVALGNGRQNNLLASEEGVYVVKTKMAQCEAISAPFTVKKVDKIANMFSFNGFATAPKTLKLCSENSQNISLYGGGDGSHKLYKNGQLYATFSNFTNSFNVTQQPGTYVLETTQGACSAFDTLKLEYGKTLTLFTQNSSYFSSCSRPVQPYYYVNSISGTQNNYLKWEKDGGVFSIGSSYVYPNVNGVYQLKYNNPTTGCTGESEKIAVTVPPSTERKALQLYNVAKKIQLCKNIKGTATIQATTSYTNAVWRKDGKIFSSGNYLINVSEAGKYWYEYNNGGCTIYSDTVEVTVVEIPKITITQTCNKDNTVQLSVNSISDVKYNWYNNGIPLSSGKDTVFTTKQAGKYTVEAIKNTCYATSNEANVGISLPEALSLCNGDSLKLNPTGDVQKSYAWSGPNGFTSNLQNPIIAKTIKKNQGIYTLEAIDKLGCSFKSQTKVILDDAPAFTYPSTVTLCAGSDFIFNSYLTSLPLTDTTETVGYYNTVTPNKYTFGGNFGLYNVSTKEAGVYNLTVSSSQGACTVKKPFEIIISTSPECKSISLASTSSIKACQGQVIEIPFRTTGVFVTGTNFKAYYMENYNTTDGIKSRKVILGTSKQSPVKITIPYLFDRGFSILVESEDGISSPTSIYAYTQYVNSNSIVDVSGYNRNSECTSLPLSVNYGYPYNDIQWSFNGEKLDKQNSRTITATKTGTYTFNAQDVYSGCNVSFSKEVTIGKLDKPQITNYSNELSCFNESVYMYVNGVSNASYIWRRNGILQAGNSYSINALTAGKYTVEVTKETCKANSDTIVVTQKSDTKLDIKIGSYTSSRNNEVQTYIYPYLEKSGSSFSLYKLYKDNQLYAEGSGSEVEIKGTGKYFFKVSKGNCEALSSVFDYKGVKNDTILNDRYLYYGNGNYDFSSRKIQICDTSIVRYFYSYLQSDYNTSIVRRKLTAYKDGKVLPVYNGNAPVYPSIRYIPNESQFNLYFRGQGSYYVVEEITFADSSKYKYTYGKIDVSVSNMISLGSQNNISTCADSTSIYGSYYSQGQRPILFTWKKDGVVYKKTTDYNNINLIVKQSGNYALETTFKGGCMAVSSTNKVVLNKMLISVDTTSRFLCDGTSISLLNSYPIGYLSDTAKISYQWMKDGKDIALANGKIIPNNYIPVFSLKEAGVYSVKTLQGKCEGVSSNINVKIETVPNNINYVDSVRFCQTQTIDLKTTDNASLSYLWERDGDFLKDANKATLNINQGGVYRVLNRKGSCWNYTPKVRAKVLENILPTAVISGSKDLNYADTAKVSIAFTSHAPWTFKLSDGKEYTATKSPFEVSLRPQFSTNYTLSEVKNVCGVGTVSGEANIKILILASEPEEGVSLNVFPVPTQEDVTIQLMTDKPEVMEWTLSNLSGGIVQREVSVNRSSKHEANISLKELPEGTYLLRIQAGEKSLYRKIMKTH
ncbi:putative secreted protein (Por secretion system target) [Arcicella aurantiaca]|uniref:Putative secreted protein (Por secretion system target) n=1 Tax=Arcicella aurantiaca TaxID=591202 RepID=A0A316ECH6_9BACT|nr:T9SS type A sorting domain-containing protein [Arcicella aurantiaca]PWK27323.1 putative secreted protein (Por secretion system target) [Arcicella aurantiaca]